MREVRFAVMLAVSCLACRLPAEAAPAPGPAAQRLFITYGDYMTGQNDMPGLVMKLVTAAEPERPGLLRLPLGIGAHGDTVAIWQCPGTAAWIDGTGAVDKTEWRDNYSSRKVAAAVQGRKADVVMVQLALRCVNENREQAQRRKETEDAVAGYVALARRAGAKLVFCVLPGGQHVPCKPGKRGAEPVKKTEADFESELMALNAECLRLAQAHGAVLAPIPLAYAALRQAHPELEIHPPVSSTDSHPSPRDSYLFACTVAMSLLEKKLEPVLKPEEVFARINDDIKRGNEKNKSQPPKELVSLTAGEQKAIHEAAWAAVEEFRAQLARPAATGKDAK